MCIFFFKQKTAYEMRISDWSSDVCSSDLTPVVFVFLIYLLHTTGELCLSPVGLSAMNRLAPAHMASLIMGTWFFASATGNFVSGLIAAATDRKSTRLTSSN